MFERHDLEELAAYEGQSPVVSLYLNLPPHLRGTPEAYRARVKNLLRQANGRAPNPDVTVIERYFDRDFDWSGRSVAVFSGQGDGLWKTYQFAVPLRSYVHVGRKPFIMPLADLMDTYGSYTVAVVEQPSMRLHHFHLGEPVATQRVSGDEVRNITASGGNRQAGIVRGQDPTARKLETVRANMKHFVEVLDAFGRQHKTDGLLLGGTEQVVAQFKDVLTSTWRERLLGTMTIAPQASEKEVRDRSLEVLQANQKARQEKLVENIRTAAAKSSNGAVGLEGTLEALHAGRVQMLALVEGLEAPGYRCTTCGYITVTAADECPFCGNPMVEIQNAAEHAVREVVEQGGEVEFLEEESPLVEVGGIAALLRY